MVHLKLENIFKRYGTVSDYAVNDLCFTGKKGEFLSILGPSGCGKTTTLRMIAGLEDVTKGEIIIGDTVINNMHPKDRKLGLAFEDYALYSPLNVFDNIAYNLRAKKLDSKEIENRVHAISEIMHVTKILKKFPKELSGGQKQRVNIARAIVRNPDVLLLDEPMSHLDGKLRQVLRQEIRKLHKEIGCTTILVTHDQLEAMSLADTLIIMNLGVLQQIGSPSEIYNNPENEFVAGFIGDPPTNIVDAVFNVKNGKCYFSFYGIEVRVSQHYLKKLKAGQNLRLGIRPDDIEIVPEGSPVKISVFENLGEEKRISIKLKDDLYFIISSYEKLKYSSNEHIQIIFKENKAHLFDENGLRIK